MYTLFAMIGASPLRKEDRRLLTGAGRYLDDLRREGMLHLGVLRSVEAHARIVKIEASRARALAGVVAVWSAADLAEITKPIATPRPARSSSGPPTRTPTACATRWRRSSAFPPKACA